jgi:hypothetical protein
MVRRAQESGKRHMRERDREFQRRVERQRKANRLRDKQPRVQQGQEQEHDIENRHPQSRSAALGPEPGWYADPWRRAPLRWWDGSQWTSATFAQPS